MSTQARNCAAIVNFVTRLGYGPARFARPSSAERTRPGGTRGNLSMKRSVMIGLAAGAAGLALASSAAADNFAGMAGNTSICTAPDGGQTKVYVKADGSFDIQSIPNTTCTVVDEATRGVAGAVVFLRGAPTRKLALSATVNCSIWAWRIGSWSR